MKQRSKLDVIREDLKLPYLNTLLHAAGAPAGIQWHIHALVSRKISHDVRYSASFRKEVT